MLSKEEFYFRFSNLTPGSVSLGDGGTHSAVYFERLSMAGLEEMHRYSKDVRLYEYFEMPPFDTVARTREYIEKLERRMAGELDKKTSLYWFVRRKEDRYLIGTAALVSLNYDRQSIEWGYGVDPELWGQGYILQIEEMLKQYVFETLELNRLYGTTMVTNARTIASLLASGMQHEGTMRQYYCKNGVYTDGWHYSMLRSEYLEAKQPRVTERSQVCSPQDVVEFIKSVLTEETITTSSNMCTVPSWDSLNHMAIMVAIAEKTGVSLSPAEVMQAVSVESIAKILAGKSAAR